MSTPVSLPPVPVINSPSHTGTTPEAIRRWVPLPEAAAPPPEKKTGKTDAARLPATWLAPPGSLFYGIAYAPLRRIEPLITEYVLAFQPTLRQIPITTPGNFTPTHRQTALNAELQDLQTRTAATAPEEFPPHLLPANPATPLLIHLLHLQSVHPRQPRANEVESFHAPLGAYLSRRLTRYTPAGPHLCAPFRPSPQTRYLRTPPTDNTPWLPLLFVSPTVTWFPTLPASLPPDEPCLTDTELRLPHHTIILTGPADIGRVLAAQGQHVADRLLAHFAPHLEPTANDAQLPPHLSRLAVLQTHLHDLLATYRKTTPPPGPERSPDGCLLPTPEQAAEQALAARVAGHPPPDFPHLQLHGDPAAGAVWVSRRCPPPAPPPARPALPSEPWLAGQPPGVIRTLAAFIDEAVWQGRPKAVAELLAAFPPDILQQRLTRPARERWRLTAHWAGQSGHPAPARAFHSLPAHIRRHLPHDVHHHLPLPPETPEAQLLVHTHELEALLRQLPNPADRETILTGRRRSQTPWETAMQRSGIVEAGQHLAEWLANHDPQPEPVSTRLTLQIWTPRLLTRLENLLTGTPAEAGFHEALTRLARTLQEHLTTHTPPELEPAARLHHLHRQLWEHDTGDHRPPPPAGKNLPDNLPAHGAVQLTGLLISRLAWLETLDMARHHWATTLLTHLSDPKEPPSGQPDPALMTLGKLLPVLRLGDPRWQQLWGQLHATPAASEPRQALCRMARQLLDQPPRPDTTELRNQLGGWLPHGSGPPAPPTHPDQATLHQWLFADRPPPPVPARRHHPLQPYL